MFTILHLTDVHFGQLGMVGRWPTIKAQLKKDLDHILGQTGSIDLIAFTGDIANHGLPEEFREATKFIEELCYDLYERSGTFPFFAAVPGNHDLQRPTRNSPAGRVLEELWNDETEHDFFETDGDDVNLFAQGLFANYSEWMRNAPFVMAPQEHIGVLPGDYAAAVEAKGLRLGILGLNSSYRHISDRANEGSLTISPHQIQSACGGDLPKWSAQHDVCIVLTHHPLSWVKNAGDARDSLFNDATQVRLHLCGHLHGERYTIGALASEGSHLVHQGQSLFGLESWGPNGGQDRQHGYAILTIEQVDEELQLRVWPRSTSQNSSGIGMLQRDSRFGLERDESSSRPLILKRRTTQQPNVPQDVPQATIQLREPMTLDEVSRASADDDAIKQLMSLMENGDLVAVVGDLFSEASANGGTQFESFRADLWAELGADLLDDRQTPTEELLRISGAPSSEFTKELISRHLSIASPATVDSMRRLIVPPWSALVYLSPVPSLEEAMPAGAESRTRYKFFDATSGHFRLPGDRPFILRMSTKADSQSSRTLRIDAGLNPDPSNPLGDWHRYTRQLLARSPVVYFADTIRSLPLWGYISDRDTTRKTQRAPAFLICPELDAQKRAALELYGIRWIQSDVNSFARKFLGTQSDQIADGLRRQSSHLKAIKDRTLQTISTLSRAAGSGSRDYLLGSSPTWGDICDGYSVELLALDRIAGALEQKPLFTHIVTGTAGSGRTTLLMQLGLRLSSAGSRVAWLDSNANNSLESILDEVNAGSFDVVIVDDADAFGGEATRLIERLRGPKRSRQVVVGVRSVRHFVIEDLTSTEVHPLGSLSPKEIRELVTLLGRHRAVANRKLTEGQLYELITSAAQGELLVGMIQATSGLPFNEKIASECTQLSIVDLTLYGCFAITTAELGFLSTAQAMEAVGGDPREAWRAFNRLIGAGLIRRTPDEAGYEVRHRVVAEEVRSFMATKGLLGKIVQGVLGAFAASAADIRDNSVPERRTLIRLLNHSYLIGLRLSEQEIRTIYSHVEDLLEEDFHYWLQRGAFEVEKGQSKHALHDLQRALTTPGGETDYKVLTEFAFLRLRLARGMDSFDSNKMALEAMLDLHQVLRVKGVEAPHTLVVLAREAVPWLRTASIARTRREELAQKSLELLKACARLDSSNDLVASTRGPAVMELEKLLGDPQD